jgi:Protein of unknown function (DUF2946)
MAVRKGERTFAAAWLGLLALAVQALLPVLLAVEIGISRADGTRGLFSECAYGHRHVAAPQGGSGKPSDTPGHDDGDGGPCPVCIALLAAPPFTAPTEIALPLPVAGPVDALAYFDLRAPATSIAAAYRSRAPPIA